MTRTLKESVYLGAAGRSPRVEDLQSSHPLQHRIQKSLEGDGQERPFPVHLPAPARGAYMLFNAQADRSGGSAPPAHAEDGATRTDRGGGDRQMCIVRTYYPQYMHHSPS
ncbi:MAG: hypothetical protein ISR58_21000 [Anaerolineales bacterium]|nr:hypothetical protein [Anaerolineales bacterium]